MNISKMFPDDNTILDLLKNEILSGLNCMKPGIIDSVDLINGTITAEIVYKIAIDNNRLLDYPILVDCPVFTLQGAGAFIEFPIKKGDFCLLIFSDRDIDNWWINGGVSQVNTSRKHSISDGFALVGVNTKESPLTRTGGPRIYGKTKKIELENDSKKASVLFDDLLTLIENLIDDISGLVTVGSSATQTLNPATIATLAARKANFVAKKAEYDLLFGSN